MKEIQLTQGKVTLIDDRDYFYLNMWKWHAVSSGSGLFYARASDYTFEKLKVLHMHRVIMKLEDPLLKVDHINGNSLDNRRENLRVCTQTQNVQNRRAVTNSTSKYLGVHIYSKTVDGKIKYVAAAKKDKERYWLGYYFDEEEAARAYDKKAIELFGEYANLNFATEGYEKRRST